VTSTPSTASNPDGHPISVVIADDQRLVRAGFRVILASEPGIHVVGEAADGLQAVELARTWTGWPLPGAFSAAATAEC